MPDKKISDLALTAAVNTDDTFEKSKHNAAPSERMTVAQLVTFLQTALASLSLNGGKIVLNTAAGNVTIGEVGTNGSLNINDPGGNANVSMDGSGAIACNNVALNDGNTVINPGGATSLGGNGSAGLLSIVDAVGAGVHQLNGGGSAFFGGNTISFPGDGSASFANSVTTIAASGDIEITDNTQGVIIKSPGGIRYRIVVDDAGVLSTVAA